MNFTPTEKLLRKIVSFQTVTGDHQKTEALFDFLKKELRGLPLFITHEKFGGYPSLLITTQKTKKPTLWLCSHVDVVPGEREQFTLQEKGRRLYGRGAYDMNFATAAYLKLLQKLGKKISEYDFGIMLTSDEEVGGFYGVNQLVKKGYRSKVAVVPDEGKDLNLNIASKGVWHLTVSTTGVAAHASHSWKGRSATTELTSFLHEVYETLFRDEHAKKDHWHRTFNIGTLKGCEALNQIPDYAEAGIDIRTVSQEEFAEVECAMEKMLKKYPHTKVKTKVQASAFALSLENPYAQEYVRLKEKVTKKKHIPQLCHGSCDARFFAEKGIPALVMIPTGAGEHGRKEWIDRKSLEQFEQILEMFVESVAKKDTTRRKGDAKFKKRKIETIG
ncbi:MAG TPA: M20 family metallopeptidase [Candidatus Paceibacterota bacterium]|nr:M20 family metallopeptidase [Candidatus Paceibacterota bacterium]